MAPVHSPLSAAALRAGARAAVVQNGHPAHAEAQVAQRLRERYAANAVLLTNSGTAALTAALRAILKDRPGSAIALPAYACYDLATAADGAGASVFLYDLDPHTLAPDMAQVDAILRRGVAAIVAVHLFGVPLDLNDVDRLAAKNDTVVIEDAAQALGATLHNRPVGNQGSLGVLSFGRGKGLTGGSGGALLAHDAGGQRILDRARGFLGDARRGWGELLSLTAQFLLERPNVYALPAALPFLRLGETIYHTPRPLREPSRASFAVVAATWELAEQESVARQRNAERLLDELRAQPDLETIAIPRHARAGYLRLPVIASPVVRRSVTKRSARRLGIMPGYPKALCDLEGFRERCLNAGGAFPGSRLLAQRLCTLPTHGRLGGRDLARLEDWIRTAASG